MQKRRVALAVQCEGNGHFTQALGIAESLREHLGIEVVCVVLNACKREHVPAHFLARFAHVPCIYVDGPVLVRERHNQAMDKVGIVWHAFAQASQYLGSIETLRARFTELAVDTVINLFDSLLVFYMQHFRPRHILCINVATQFKQYVRFDSAYVGKKRVEVTGQHALFTDIQAAQAFAVIDTYVRLHTLPVLSVPRMRVDIESNRPTVSTTSLVAVAPHAIRTASVALCPFRPSSSSSGVWGSTLFVNPAMWLAPFPRLSDASLHASPCFVSRAELRSQIVALENMNDPSQGVLRDALTSVAPGTIRLVGYVNVPTFVDQLMHFCAAGVGAPATTPLDWLQQFARPFFPPAAAANTNAAAPPFHLFLFRRQEQEMVRLLPNLTCFRLDRRNFLSCMNACDGYVSTAGVESVCEAVVLDKPVLVVPGQQDEEQYMNALIFAQHLEGVFARVDFCLTDLLSYIVAQRRASNGARAISEQYSRECASVREWLDTSSRAFAGLFQRITIEK